MGPVVHKQVHVVLVGGLDAAAGGLCGFHRARHGPAVLPLTYLQACAHEARFAPTAAAELDGAQTALRACSAQTELKRDIYLYVYLG